MKPVQIKIIGVLISAFFISIFLIRFIFISKSPKPASNWEKNLVNTVSHFFSRSVSPTPSPVIKTAIELILPPYIEKPTEEFINSMITHTSIIK